MASSLLKTGEKIKTKTFTNLNTGGSSMISIEMENADQKVLGVSYANNWDISFCRKNGAVWYFNVSHLKTSTIGYIWHGEFQQDIASVTVFYID